jgi:hypothetical protein
VDSHELLDFKSVRDVVMEDQNLARGVLGFGQNFLEAVKFGL